MRTWHTDARAEVDTRYPRLLAVPVAKFNDPAVRAALDLQRFAGQLSSVVQKLPPLHHTLALNLLSDWRVYCFEQNRARWPDGLFYMLDRGYGHWRGHRIGFNCEQLSAFGLPGWSRRAKIASSPSTWPMQADGFQLHPRRQLANYAEIVAKIADHLHERAQGSIRAPANECRERDAVA